MGQVGHLPYHFLVVNTGNDVTMIFIRDSDSEVRRLAAFAVTQCSGTRYCLVQSRLICMTIAWA